MRWFLQILWICLVIGAFASFVRHQEATAVTGIAKDIHATIGSISFDVNTGEVKGDVSTKYRKEAVKQMDKNNNDFFGTLSFILGGLSVLIVIFLFITRKRDR